MTMPSPSGLTLSFASTLLMSLLSACGEDATHDQHGHAEHDHGASHERLLIADGLAPLVHVVDVDSRQTLASYEIAGPARVYRGAFGRWGYAVQGEQNRVQIIDSGVSVQDHGDHAHVNIHPPSLHAFTLDGARPVHFVAHGSHGAAFFDDSGIALVLDERSLSGAAPSYVSIQTALPHHGVALAFGGRFLATTAEMPADSERASPTGLAAYDTSGAATGEQFGPCPGLHGEASLKDLAAFGCSDGVLVVEGGSALSARKIAYPTSTLEQPPRVGTVKAHPEAEHLVGNYGPDHLCLIDISQSTLTPVAVPGPYMQFGFDAHGEHVLLLDKSGTLHVLGAHDLLPIASLTVTSAPTNDSGHGAHHPQFAVGADHVFVTDPQLGKVVMVDLGMLAIVDELPVTGSPTKIALLGGVPEDA